MIIIVIIQYLNTVLPVQNSGRHTRPGTPMLVFVCHHKHVDGDIETGKSQ